MYRKRIFDIIQIGSRGDWLSRGFDIFITITILLNISVLILETFQPLAAYFSIMHAIELITILIFCVEYGLRIWTADFLYPKLPRQKAILRFIFSFDGIVDLFTILPLFFLYGFSVFRIIRVVRIFRLFRINAYYDSLNVIATVLSEKKNQILSSVFIILVLIMASSLCIYSAEREAQPDVFKNAFSGIWWSVSAIFTVGYGDIYPVTILGRIMAVVITFLGVGAVAIPTGIISAGFVEHYSRLSQAESIQKYKNSTALAYIDKHSGFLNLRIADAESKHDICVTAVIRDGQVILPSDDVLLTEGDTIAYLSIL